MSGCTRTSTETGRPSLLASRCSDLISVSRKILDVPRAPYAAFMTTTFTASGSGSISLPLCLHGLHKLSAVVKMSFSELTIFSTTA